jgi:hypothetical protein
VPQCYTQLSDFSSCFNGLFVSSLDAAGGGVEINRAAIVSCREASPNASDARQRGLRAGRDAIFKASELSGRGVFSSATLTM